MTKDRTEGSGHLRLRECRMEDCHAERRRSWTWRRRDEGEEGEGRAVADVSEEDCGPCVAVASRSNRL